MLKDVNFNNPFLLVKGIALGIGVGCRTHTVGAHQESKMVMNYPLRSKDGDNGTIFRVDEYPIAIIKIEFSYLEIDESFLTNDNYLKRSMTFGTA